jgi:hypothetical protein
MAINTLVTIKDSITAFAEGHGQLQGRVIFEADDHRSAYITEENTYPLLFVAPIDVAVNRAMNVHTLRVYVYERINDDRLDVWENANDTSLILRDIRVWWNDYGVDDINIVEDPIGQFGCDKELDNLVGYFADIRFEIPSHGRCQVPVDVVPGPPSPSCADATQIITDSLGNQLYSNSIPSGATETQVIQDSAYTVEYVNGTLIESGNILAEGSVTVQVPNPIVCADATVNVNGAFWDNVPSGGTENVIVRQSTGSTQVGSIQGQYFRIDDSTAVLKDTLGTTISTTSIKAEDTEDIVAPNTTIEVNGTIEGTVVSGSTVDIQLSDSGGVVTPTSVTQVGNDFQVVLPDAAAPTGWVRPSGWLALDTVGVGTENFSGLFAVYETQKNVNTIQITTSGVNTINWGDGTSQAVTSAVLYTKVYDYATITSPVLVDEAGLNYKMVVVNINMDNVTVLYIDRNTTATVIGNTRNLGWLDIAVDCSTMTNFSPSGQGYSVRLQRLLIYNVGAVINGIPAFVQLAALKVLKFPFEKLQSVSQTFINNFGDCRDENNLPLNLNLTINTGGGTNVLANSHLTELGNITAPLRNSFQTFLFNSILLKKVGNIDASAASNLVSTFAQGVKLTGIINVTTSATLTNIYNVIGGCFLVDGLIISDCTNVTNTTIAVNGCKNLKTLILTGLTRGITVDDCLMEATEINAFFTSLGIAVGSQTIFIRRNPGSATCDTTIATGKGFTVVIL